MRFASIRFALFLFLFLAHFGANETTENGEGQLESEEENRNELRKMPFEEQEKAFSFATCEEKRKKHFVLLSML
ncbi:hypothetical protein niasHS_010518 [Heterodera schachtii]|uniref:Uncharacterized protein n=1 Tax=Heterodera schachtii TaxID=97005 RepID=A0ABD2ITR3_HETSC